MDSFSPRDSAITITNGTIENIASENNTTFITITYMEGKDRRRNQETIRLVVGNQTVILDENRNTIRARELRRGMTVNAIFSSAMTRSIPPQASAFLIQIVRRPVGDRVTVGRIIDINKQNRNFTTISDGNLSSFIRFNVPRDAIVLDRFGRPMNFSRLAPGIRVRVRHTAFMTASIPPQTTAFEVQVL